MSSDPITTGFVATGVALALYVCLILVRRAQARRDSKPNERESQHSGTPNLTSEQALIVKISLSNTEFGQPKERAEIQRLEDLLQKAIEAKPGTGEFDGDEFGNGFCAIYMYGPSAARLFDATIPTLLNFQAPSGSFIIKRYGGPGEKEERISLGQPMNLS
jgi:hypothetical protein